MTNPVPGYTKKISEVFNIFQRLSVDGYDFADYSDGYVNFRFGDLAFSLTLEGSGTVEYSFNGTSVHGDLTAGAKTEFLQFYHRRIAGVWVRAKTGDAVGSVVRFEAWAI